MSFLVKSRPKTVAEFLGHIGAVEAPEMPDNIGTLAGGAIGAIAFPNHRVLGLIGGASLGRNLPMLLSEHRGAGVRHMVITGTAVAGALIGGANRKTKVGKVVGSIVGFSAGWLLAGAIDAYRSKE
jgi:hypothetical protein